MPSGDMPVLLKNQATCHDVLCMLVSLGRMSSRPVRSVSGRIAARNLFDAALRLSIEFCPQETFDGKGPSM